ncbi:pescadillo homolog [Drosophila teissieri]|uniref:pescadillo homolog n=1 Tax=Drosophila teissieri TaxID=7243 RepID=UPI001CBA2A55|nr:pescadillo homolog [Drosophila teissieri]
MADVEEEEAPRDVDDVQNEGQEAAEDLEGESEDDEQDVEVEDEFEVEEKDPFELLNESDEDDEEQQAMYKEYLEVVNAIDTQNAIIKELKAKSTRLMFKKCKTYGDKKEYKRLRVCQEREEIHLKVLVNRAMHLQNFGSPRRYRDVEMEVTEDEQRFFFTELQSTFSGSCPIYSTDEYESDSESDDALCCT